MGYWSDNQLEAIIAPPIKDQRGRAFVRSVDGMIADVPISTFEGRNEATCSEAALPALVAEYSMQEYIEPGLPADVQRRILSRRNALQARSGFDDGVLLGLELLGMSATILHWHEQSPEGPPNTHRITVMMDQVLYPDDLGYFSERQMAAMWRMIEATKRWSQLTELRVGVERQSPQYVGVFSTGHVVAIAEMNVAPPPVVDVQQTGALVPTIQIKTEVTASR